MISVNWKEFICLKQSLDSSMRDQVMAHSRLAVVLFEKLVGVKFSYLGMRKTCRGYV